MTPQPRESNSGPRPLRKLSDSSGMSCSCYDVRYHSDPRCPVHARQPGRTCRVCGGVNGQHYSGCIEGGAGGGYA
jgi:hypothetical protein